MILPTIFRTKFKIRVLYKSGNSHEFWASKFNFEKTESQATYTWSPVSQSSKPVFFGAEDVEAVYVIKTRWNIFALLFSPFKTKED